MRRCKWLFVLPVACALVTCCLIALNADAGTPLGIAPSQLSAGESLQTVLDRGGPLVYVPKDNYTLAMPLHLRSNATIVFESGTVIEAAAGAFQGLEDCLIDAKGVGNISIKADGAIFRMRRIDYTAAPYAVSEFRHCLGLYGVSNFSLTGGTFDSSGGDGIYIGPWTTGAGGGAGPPDSRVPCSGINIAQAVCSNNYRQGISVVSGKGVIISDCLFSGTAGRSPQSGLDAETSAATDVLDLIVRRCQSVGNRGPAYCINLLPFKPSSIAPRIVFDDCSYGNLAVDQPVVRMSGVFSSPPIAPATYPHGFLAENLPRGSLITLDIRGLQWTK